MCLNEVDGNGKMDGVMTKKDNLCTLFTKLCTHGDYRGMPQLDRKQATAL